MNIPKGYKLVPVEPTEEILRKMLAVKWPATYRKHLRFDGAGPQTIELTERHIAEATKQYSAAIADAPTPAQPIYDEAKERELFEVRIHRIAVEKGYEYMDFLLKRDVSGEYQTTWVDMAWLGWSECAQSRAKSVEVGDE